MIQQDACEAYTQVGEKCHAPQTYWLTVLTIKGKVGKVEYFGLSSVDVMLPSSAPPPSWAGEFSCPYMVKVGPQTTFF